jgi:hypothetical protein
MWIMRRHKLGRVLVATPAMAGAVIMATTGLADATRGVRVPNYKQNYGSVVHGRPYDWIEACDRQADGMGVYVEYWTNKGNHGYIWDHNGSKPGCGNARVYEPEDVTRFKVCRDDNGPFRGDTCSGARSP